MTFQIAAEAARNITGEVIPLDLAPHARGRMGIVRRVPIGPIAAISPFFPLNLERAQDRAGHRRREPDRPEAGHQDPSLGFDAGAIRGRGRRSRGRSASSPWIARRAIGS